MLNAPTRLSYPALGIRPEAARSAPQLALYELFIGTRRQIAIIVIATIAASGLGLLYLSVASPRYTAVAQLLSDTQRSRSPLDAPNSSIDSSVIASQIETLKSETIARTVIGRLGLDNDLEFTEPNLISRIAAWIGVTAPAADPQRARQRRAIDRFGRALEVFQAGRSYVAVVRFTSVDPEKAARITNAICEAYIDDQLDAKTLTSTRANLWFERRLNELERQVNRADQALRAFRRENPEQLDSLRQEQLQSLVADAQAQKRAYDTVRNLSRYSQAVDQQTFPTTEARVVTWADPPLTRSWPPIGLTLLFSAMAGCGLGMLIAYAREHLGRTVRTRRHVEHDLNVRCLGFLPLLTSPRCRRATAGSWTSWGRSSPRPGRWPARANHVGSRSASAALGVYALLGDIRTAWRRRREWRRFGLGSGSWTWWGRSSPRPGRRPARENREGSGSAPAAPGDYALLGDMRTAWRRRRKWRRFGLGSSKEGGIALLNADDSPSGAGELLIGVRVALDACNHSSTGTSIGITSPRFGEGKTTVAFNLAKCIADGGKRVLLIDADLRRLSLTKALAPQSECGLPEVLRGAVALTDIAVMPGAGFHLLAQPLDRITRRPPDILSSRQMREMLDSAKLIFDYVVLDLPPVIDHVDACASANQLDLFVLVAEWGRTRITDLEAVWARSDHIAERVVGIIVNKAPRGSEWR